MVFFYMIDIVACTWFDQFNYIWSYWLDTLEIAAFYDEVTQPYHDIQQYNSHCSVEYFWLFRVIYNRGNAF